MKLETLELKNFRNHTNLKLSFPGEVTIIFGENGAGKTNILEAAHMLSTTKSLRTQFDKEVINYDAEFARVAGNIRTSDDEKYLELVITKSKSFENASTKKAKVGKIARPLMLFAGTLNTVLFTPHDVEIFTESPAVRRRYLDMLLGQSDRNYKKYLSDYTRAIKQRNRILEKIRELGSGREELEFWTSKALETGRELQKSRTEFFKFARDGLNKHSEALNTNPAEYSITYDKSEISYERLEKYKDAEVASARTLVGPHRDDFIIELNGHNIAKFGSRGEKRATILGLKLCEIDFIERERGERPVLLLDDIFSELDESHRKAVMNVVEKQQTIITTADEKDATNGFEVIRL